MPTMSRQKEARIEGKKEIDELHISKE